MRLRGAFTRAFEQSGIPVQNLDRLIAQSVAIQPHGSDHFPQMLADYGVLDPEVVQAARTWFHANRFLGLELFPGARNALTEIRALSGVQTIGIITNGPADVQNDKLALLDLGSLIDFAVISGEFGAEKPDSAIFAEALRQGNQTANQAIFIGDSPEHDMDGARLAGMDRIWINRAQERWRRPTPQPEREVPSVVDIPDQLRS